MKYEQKRATFEDVRNAQNTIRKWIDELILDNKTLEEEDREKFIKMMQLASLGIGTKQPFFFSTKSKAHRFQHMESAIYWAAYQDRTPIELGNDRIEIKEIWKGIREKWCFVVFPYALQESIKMSKEQTYLGPAKAKEV